MSADELEGVPVTCIECQSIVEPGEYVNRFSFPDNRWGPQCLPCEESWMRRLSWNSGDLLSELIRSQERS